MIFSKRGFTGSKIKTKLNTASHFKAVSYKVEEILFLQQQKNDSQYGHLIYRLCNCKETSKKLHSAISILKYASSASRGIEKCVLTQSTYRRHFESMNVQNCAHQQEVIL